MLASRIRYESQLAGISLLFLISLSIGEDDISVNTEEILRSVHEEAQSNTSGGKLLSIENLNKIAKSIMQETGDGLMLYFGA